MSSASSSSASFTSSERSSSRSSGRPRSVSVISSGRGGSGNIRPQADSMSVASLALEDEEVLQKRRAQIKLNPRVKVKYTGRGGVGNIRAATQATQFDVSMDPDDDYERLVIEAAKDAKEDKMYTSGRGGSGSGKLRPRSVSTPESISSKKTKSKRRYSESSSGSSSGVCSSHYGDAEQDGEVAPLPNSLPATSPVYDREPQSPGGTNNKSPHERVRGKGWKGMRWKFGQQHSPVEEEEVVQEEEVQPQRLRTVEEEGEMVSFLEF